MPIDLFNGDADGLLARHQFHLAHPREGVVLVSGVKRDVKLCRHLADQADLSEVTVFDISLESNESFVEPLLSRNGTKITWFDHHRRGQLEDGPALTTHIDLSPRVCSALLVDAAIERAWRPWAIAAAFGDNLRSVAEELCKEAGFNEEQARQLQDLGETLNYNGYGQVLEDLACDPVLVARDLEAYDDPFTYLRGSDVFQTIAQQKASDEAAMGDAKVLHQSPAGEVILLPAGDASRRLSGIYGNDKATAAPHRAHAILTHLDQGEGFRISIRSPLERPQGADQLATRFPTGGGRAGAAGVNELPPQALDEFLRAFDEVYAC